MMIAKNFRENAEAFYAADASIERAMNELATTGDWSAVLGGSLRSSFVDGAPNGLRMLPDGSTVDLAAVLNMANCRKVSTCSTNEMDAVTADRPWAANNPRWQLYAYGNLRDLLFPKTIDSSYYVIVMVADDSSENDNDPLRDGADSGNPGSGVLAVRAEAFGPRGARKTIEVTVARRLMIDPGRTGLRVLSWHFVRD
jgi:hypothetical protein